MMKLFTLLLAISMFVAANAADIAATQAGNWSDAATWVGGTIPKAGDNVNAGAFKITVDVDATCDNYTIAGAGVAGNLVINPGITLTVRGTMTSETTGNVDLLSGSAADSKLKLTGAAIAQNGTIGNPKGTVADDYPIVYLLTDFIVRSIRPRNLEIATSGSGIFSIGHTQANTFNCSAAKVIVKSGSNVNILGRTNIGKVDDLNEFIIESGATVYTRIIEGSFDGKKIPAAKLVIDGTLIASGQTTVRNIVIGENGVFKHGVGPTNNYPSWSGWWHQTAPADPATLQPGDFATPGSLVLGSNSTIELNRTDVQAIQGIIPENKLYFIGTTPQSYFKKISEPTEDSVFAEQKVPYANLVFSGGSTKSVGSNLVAKGNVTIAAGTSLLIPAGKVMVVNGTVTTNETAIITVEGAFINAKSNDISKGTVSASISATNEVTLVATPKEGFRFVNWTEDPAGEISTSATLVAFIPADASTRTIVANFDISTGVSTNKVNPFVTVADRNLILNGEVSVVELYNLQGRLIQSHTNVTSINVLNSGIYIVRMQSAQGINMQKVFIK